MSTESQSRHVLLHGLAFILAGLLWGLVIPHTTYPRLALGAHIQFEFSGLLYLVTALALLKVPHNVGTKSLAVLIIAVYLTWFMAISEAANAFWGTKQTLSITGFQANAPGGTAWQETVVTLTHIPAGLVLILAFILLLVGFARKPAVLEHAVTT